jgi:hypothetical protein
MGKLLIFSLFIGVLFTMSGCGGARPSSGAQGKTPATAAPTSQATLGPSQATLVPSPKPEGTATYRLMNSCDLLNSRDVASLFSSAEVEGPKHQVSQVNHLVFSTATISATESSCVYYVFHEPGSKDMELLQVTYWVDIPGQATPSVWAQVWVDAGSKAAQAVSGIGDGAFYNDGRLTFKKGSLYVTIEIVGTNLNTDTSAGVNQQIKMEKQIALDALSRLG